MIESCSVKCHKSELDFFAPRIIQTDKEELEMQKYYPVTTITKTAPIEFNITGTGQYLDLALTELEVVARIVDEKGAALAENVKVGPINYLLHSMFSQVDVYLNNTLVSTSDNLYPYRAYIETLLSYGNDAKESQHSMALWYKDTAGKMDFTDATEKDVTKNNSGLTTRQSFMETSTPVYLRGRLHVDMFQQGRALLSGCDLRIKLHRSKDAFALMSAETNPGYQLVIDRIELNVYKNKLSGETALDIERSLEGSMGARYLINNVDLKTITIPANVATYAQDNLYTGQLPVRLVLGMVDNAAVQGSYTNNPYNFQHFGVTDLTLTVNGKAIQHTMDFAGGNYLGSYASLFSALNKRFSNFGNGINRLEYAKGYTLWAFDLTPDASCGHSGPSNEGSVRIEFRFKQALAKSVCLVCYSERPACVSIDKSRNVSVL